MAFKKSPTEDEMGRLPEEETLRSGARASRSVSFAEKRQANLKPE